MSNTYKTDPFWVQLANGYHRSEPFHITVGEHDCDLPEKPIRTFTHCHWSFIYMGKRVCSCWLCHGSYFAGERKRERQRGKSQIREQSKDLHNPRTDCPVCGESIFDRTHYGC